MPTEPQQGGTISIWLPNGWPEANTVHAEAGGHWESGFAVSPMWDVLFKYPSMLPGIATGLDMSDDGLVYTVHLRDDVKFHDGEPLTAEDVKYTLELDWDPMSDALGEQRYGRTLIDYLAYAVGEADEITGLKVIDDYTLEFHLESVDVTFPALFLSSFGWIHPKHILETLDRAEVLNGVPSYFWEGPIGMGPFKFVEYVTDRYIEFEAFEDYYRGRPYADKVFMKIATPEVAIIMLQKGELDWTPARIALTEAGRLDEDPNVDILVAPNDASAYGLEINYYAHDGFWQNPIAKQALLYSVDRQAYVDNIMAGYGVVRHSRYDGTKWACPTMVEYNYDPDKAEELWDSIGMTRDKRGELIISFMSWLGMKDRMDYLPMAQADLRKMGFPVNVDIIDNSLIMDYIYGGSSEGKDWDFHVLMSGSGADPGGIEPFLLPDSTANWGYRNHPFPPDPTTNKKEGVWYWTNDRVTEILAQAKVELDEEKRTALFQELDCILNQEFPTYITAAASLVYGKSPRLQGVDHILMSEGGQYNSLWGIWDWWIWEQ
jgi:peptide/nickel transport system substrate-binding protein